MTKRVLLLILPLIFLLGFTLSAQVNISGGSTVNGSYPSLAAAISALNGATISGAVTVDVTAGHSEILPVGGIVMTATGTAANPITIQKSGAGTNPVLNAYVGTSLPAGAAKDGMFTLLGSDYVTIDGIDLFDGNVAGPTEMMEAGYGLFKASATDGCQNNTIQNCVITLNRNNSAAWTYGHNGSVGIAVQNSTYAASDIELTITAASGGNSDNNFYGNTIQNCQSGIAFIGFADVAPFDFADSGNDVGGAAPATGNTIINYGGGTGATARANAVFMKDQWDFNISYNTINNNDGSGVTHPALLGGIFCNDSSDGASGDINNNTISLASLSGATSGIENAAGSSGAGNTININNNTITNCNDASTSTWYGIWNSATGVTNVNINNNTFSNINRTVASGTVYMIYNSAGSTANSNLVSISGNSFSNFTNSVMGTGTFYFIYTNNSTDNSDISNNTWNNLQMNQSSTNYLIYNAANGLDGTLTVNNNQIIGGYQRTGTSFGTTYCYYAGSSSTMDNTQIFSNNSWTNINNGTGSLYGIYNFDGLTSNAPVKHVFNNTIENNTCGSTFYGIYIYYMQAGSDIYDNTINNINGTGTVYGIYQVGTAVEEADYYGNEIFGLTTSSTSSTVRGMYILGSSTPLSNNNIYNNKVYDLNRPNATSGTTEGIYGSGGNVKNIYNNCISDLRSPSVSSTTGITGIYVASGTEANVSYNTVYLGSEGTLTSTGANLGGAGIYLASSTTLLNAKNNIIKIDGTASGTGYFAGLKRSTTGTNGTKPANITADHNIYFAPYIFGEGPTNTSATNVYYVTGGSIGTADPDFNTPCGLYKTFMGEAGTFYEDNLAAAGVACFSPSGASFAESGATTATTPVISEDHNGITRAALPDIGALEFAGIATDAAAPIIIYDNIPNSICISAITLTADITDVTGVNTTAGTKPRLWYKKSTENNVLAATNTSADNGWKYVEATNAASPFVFDIDYALLTSAVTNGDIIEYFVVAQDLVAMPNVGTNAASYNGGYCPVSVALAPGAFPVSNYNSYEILASPTTLTASATPGTICVSGDVQLSLGGDPATGAEYQWESSPAGANVWTTIVGATTADYLVAGVSASTDFRVIVSCGGVPISASPSSVATVNVISPAIVSTTPGSECGPGPVSVSLGATGNAGSMLNWYDVATGGTALGNGTTFNTPPITTSTTYYVEPVIGGGNESAAKPTYVATPNTSGNNWGLVFDVVNTDIVIQTVDVYSVGTGGSMEVNLTDNTGTVLMTAGPFTIPPGSVATPELVTLPVNLPVSVGTGYRLVSANMSGNCIRETSGNTYPYSSPSGNVVVTSGFITNPGSATYYWFYNWQVSSDCAGPRTPVLATVVNDPPVCPGNLSACVNDPAFVLPEGTPSGGTFSGPGVSGNMFNPATAGVGTHTITYTNCSLSCTFMITVNGLPTPAITSSAAIMCIDDTRALTATPVGGTFSVSGTGTLGAGDILTATAAGTITVTYSYTDGNGCTGSTSQLITVSPDPTPTITSSGAALCLNDTRALTANPAGGTFSVSSGPGSIGAGDILSASATGSITIEYSYTDGNGCTGTTTQVITVIGLPNPTITSSAAPMCIGDTRNLTGNPFGGTFSVAGPGTLGAGDVLTATGAGSIVVTYSYTDGNGCSVDVSQTITGNAPAMLSETHVLPTDCNTADGSIDLTVIGTQTFQYNWVGTGGFSSNSEDLSNLPAGVYNVTVTDGNGCTSTLSVSLDLIPSCGLCPEIGSTTAAPSPVCLGTSSTFSALGLMNMGTTYGIEFKYSATALTDPYTGGTAFANVPNAGLSGGGTSAVTTASVPAGTWFVYAVLSPTPQDPLCRPSAQTNYVVNALPVVTITSSQAAMCVNDTRTLTATPAGGTFVVTGSGTLVGSTLTATGAGSINVTYNYTDGNGCSNSASQTITVNPLPVVSITSSNAAMCVNDTRALVGSPAGGTFTVTGSGSLAGSTLTATSAGTINITYTYTNGVGCTNTATQTISVNALPTSFAVTGGGGYCIGEAGSFVGLSGSQSGVNYQLRRNGINTGAPLAGTGAALNFGAQPTAGTYTVQATNATSGCTLTMNGSVSVFSQNCDVSITDPCECKNNATTLTNGQFDEVIQVNAPDGQTWTVTAVTGLYASSSPAPPAAPAPITVGTQLTALGGNTYQLNGIHVDALGYSVTVSNGRTSLSISNSCSYPTPSITSAVGTFCLGTPAFPLTGNPGDANIVSAQFFINGVLAANFDPATLGLGSHTITYTVDGGEPKAFGTTDPGCIQSVSQTVQITNTPTVVSCNDRVQISLDEDCQVEVLPDMILEGTYFCDDDYTVTLRDNNRNIPNLLNASHIGRVIIARVTHNISGNSCWGEITVEDKLKPVFVCPTAPVVLDCTQNPNDVPAPIAIDNCDGQVPTNLINETRTSANCGMVTITRTFIATDYHNNISDPCTQVIQINPSLLTFPDDITWTCEQYAFNRGIVNPTALHPAILNNAAIMDLADYCCINGLDGDDVAGLAPYQAGTNWWTDGEDLDVTLDPNYDDNIDNPITDPNTFNCGTVSPEADGFTDVYNLSLFVGCPAYDECEIPGLHTPTFVNVPVYAPFNPTTGLPIRGLEDADILGLTGSGVPNVLGHSGCNFAITWKDVKIEACEGVDTSVVFKILRTWTALNWCTGEIFTDIQIIKVVDKKAPQIVFNDDDDNDGIADETETNERYGNGDGFNDQLLANEMTGGSHPECASHGLLDVPEFIDNCSGIAEFRVFTPVGEAIPVYNGQTLRGFRIPAPYLPMGIHTVTYQVTDGCGNMTSVDKRVEVIDGIPPIPICREVTQVSLSSDVDGLIEVGAQYFDEGSYDNCGPVYFKVRRMDDNCTGFNTDRSAFQDKIHFCCEDIGKTINVILRVYDVEPNPGQVTQNYLVASNNTNDCMIEVLVEDKLRPTCVAPAAVWTDCAQIPANVDLSDTLQLQNLFGNATGYDNCTVFVDELAPVVDVDICGVGQVRRRFRTLDQAGNISIGTCQQTIMIMQVTSYEIDIPGDFEDECTTVSPDSLVYREFGCDLIGVNVKEDEYPASAGGECKKIFRTYKIINWCEYDGTSDPIEIPRVDLNRDGVPGDGFTPSNPGSSFRGNYRLISNGDYVYLNIINDPVTRYLPSTGYYVYVQHIKIYDDTAPVLTDTLSGPFCGGDLDEDPCTGEVNYIPSIVETCSDVTVTWQLDAFNTVFQTADFSGNDALTGRYPLGTHTVRFRVADDCGNTSQLDVTFEIIDCKAPTPVCYNGLSIDLMASGMVELWATDFNASSYDYCHPLKFRINRVEDRNGDGFITADDYLNTPPAQDSIVLRCKDLGITYIQLWVGEESTDNVNNWDYCVSFVEVQDNFGACTGTKHSINGNIKNERNQPVSGAKLTLNTGISQVTGQNGSYNFTNLTPGDDYTLTPYLNDNPRNGVSTFDLVLISKHILNVAMLNSPYKVIAADANNSGSVTTLDLVALRKLILFVSNDLPNNTSWRFVDKNHAFQYPMSPWNFPEVINFNNLASNQMNKDFIAIKVGDVNGDAAPNAVTSIGNRSFNSDFHLQIENHEFKAGETFRVPVIADQNVAGYQFTLGYDLKSVELLDVEFNGVAKPENFNINAANGLIATSWNANEVIEGKTLFTLVFKAVEDGDLTSAIRMSQEMVQAEAYKTNGEFMGVKLQISGTQLADQAELYQNTPNPFSGTTQIGFYLPEGGKTRLTITDATGKLVKVFEGNYGNGYQTISVKDSDLNGAGVYFYELTSGNFKATRKMVLIF